MVEDGENDYDDDEGKESEGEGYIEEDLMNIDLNDGCNICMLCKKSLIVGIAK